MKYKTRKIPGSPDWMPEGVVCKVWDLEKRCAVEELVFGYREGDNARQYESHFVGVIGTWAHAEPIPAWEPTPGEYCAFWNDDSTAFAICQYRETYDKIHKTRERYSYQRVARIKGVDCACSLDELKERTDWL